MIKLNFNFNLTHLSILITIFFSSLIQFTSAAIAELDQIYYGVWLDTDVGYQDTPILYNNRLGRNASVFHIAQNMPLTPYNYTTGAGGPAPEYVIENTATDAAVFITVYPASLTVLSDNDYTVLDQSDFNRTVFLRWAPEMQGRWNPYGQLPVLFVQAWQAMYKAIKTIAPATVVVWAPNLGSGYPFGQTADIATEDLAVLDTNKNGQLDAGDDPYAPYYPGDDYVDWIGLSVYFKQFSVNTNLAQPAGFCSDILTGINSQSGHTTTVNWYDTYCAQKPSKACLIAESGAAYHPNINTGTATQLDIQRAWWQDCITNTTFMDRFPRLRLHMHFEYEKMEADIGAPDLRDYRLTNVSEVLTAFQADLNTFQLNPSRLPDQECQHPKTATLAVPTLVLQTLRNPLATGLPTLFEFTVPIGISAVSCLTSAVYLIGVGRARALRARRTMD
ncbi:glycoside hydrolase superfamily [Melampsora americana]|nr:glycoside hydrolase superfamily [Melampsora americana]